MSNSDQKVLEYKKRAVQRAINEIREGETAVSYRIGFYYMPVPAQVKAKIDALMIEYLESKISKTG